VKEKKINSLYSKEIYCRVMKAGRNKGEMKKEAMKILG
jgi:hypothetical protein